MALVFVFAFLLSLLHYFSESYSRHVERFHLKMVSFSAGLFISYIFVFLLPELVKGTEFIGDGVFVFLLIGFVAFHITEKFVYQHVTDKNKLMKELAAVHIFGFFINHFIVGMALFLAFTSSDILLSSFIIIPLALHTLTSSLTLNHIDERVKQNKLIGLLLALSPVFGTAFAFFLSPSEVLYYSLFALAVGSLLYIVFRDALPYGKAGNSRFFLLGFAISLGLLVAVNFVR